jgi:hypothetical protein
VPPWSGIPRGCEMSACWMRWRLISSRPFCEILLTVERARSAHRLAQPFFHLLAPLRLRMPMNRPPPAR